MRWRAFLGVLLGIVGATLLLGSPAEARDGFAPGSVCHASADAGEHVSAIENSPDHWNCSDSDWSIAQQRTILRFDLRNQAGEMPAALVTRLTRFDSLHLTMIAADGSSASRTLGEDDMDFATSDWLMSTPLPRIDGKAAALVVEMDAPRHLGMATDARLATPPNENPASARTEILLAGICGMLFLPLIFNVAFFRILRQRFVLWYLAASLCMFVHTLVTTGLIHHFLNLTMFQVSVLSVASWAGGIAAAGIFIADLIEPEKLDRRHRLALRLLAFWIPAWSLFYVYADGPLRPLATPVYFASFVPVMCVFVWVMLVAAMRGSRAVRFQIVAWLPLMITSGVRMVSSFTDAPLEMQMQQHVSLALEVLITFFGVIDRFTIIKQQRDKAIAQKTALEEIAVRDPLTGLYNRHGIRERFEALHLRGFNTMAVIDLDHFKHINDNHGHAVGDEVLRLAAEAMMPDEDTLVVRMGGEEFMLLLRGRDTLNRAERRRQAITVRIAKEMPGLDRVVTASMGLVERPAKARLKTEFHELYAHCDRLLYEAKRAGRNRSMSEKLQSFDMRPRQARAGS